MKSLVGRSRFAAARPAAALRWFIETIARFRPRSAGKGGRAVEQQGAETVGQRRLGGGLAPIAHGSRPFFDNAVIAAVCECPSLTYELLIAPREGVAVERVEPDETSRPAAGLVRDEGGGPPRRRPR
jgi:hypothetical protein